MSTLEKYAAKKKLTKEMIEHLATLTYGKDPGSSGALARKWAKRGAVGGGVYRAGLRADLMKRLYHGEDLGRHGTKFNVALGRMAKEVDPKNLPTVGKALLGGVAGGSVALSGARGAIEGGVYGGAAGKLVGLIRSAKYKARKKRINKALSNVALGAGATIAAS